MGRRIRHQDPDTWYFLTNRCHQQRFLLRPDKTTRRIISGCLAWAALKHRVELGFFLFMSNHFHIGARFPRTNRQYFMQDLQGEIAKRVNRHRGRSDSFFDGRYSCEPILDEEAYWDRLTYTLNNPVEARLVSHAHKWWPGVSSFRWQRQGKPFRGEWLNCTKLDDLQRAGKDNPFQKALEPYTVELSAPPGMKGTSPEEVGQEIERRVEEHRETLMKHSPVTERGFTGRKEVLKTDWRESPDNPEMSSEPWCHASCEQDYLDYKDEFRWISRLHRQASKALRSGKSATFPTGTTPPGFHRCVTEGETIHPPRGP